MRYKQNGKEKGEGKGGSGVQQVRLHGPQDNLLCFASDSPVKRDNGNFPIWLLWVLNDLIM